MSKQEHFHRPEKPLEKTREIDNEARISKEAEMKKKFNKNQKRITPWDIQLSSLKFLALNTCKKSKPENKAQFIYKCIYGEEQIELIEHELSQIECNSIIKTLGNPNTACESFFNMFFETYDKHSPKVKIKIKAKTIQNSWITKGITTSSKKKKKLYERFLKKHTPQNEQKYTNYQDLLETIKKKAKKIYYSNKKHGLL